MFTNILGRRGSNAEVKAWVSVLNNGATPAQVAMSFLTSAEYRIDLVDSYYLEFLRRPADTVGQAAWVQPLTSGVSDQAVLAAIFGSGEGYGKWS